MKSVAIITARSGSKGLKDKNIKELSGMPLIAYTIKAAIESRKFERIIVSTDSEEYARIAQKYGAEVPFLRSVQNSGDKANSWDVIREVVMHLEEKQEYYDEIMLLQPTSPLRTSEDIINSFALMDEKGANAVLGVTEMDHSPLWCNTLEEDLCMDHFQDSKSELPRQELPIYYRINGAIYLIRRQELNKKPMFADKCYAYIMPRERSIDIDTEFDFKVAECFLQSMSSQKALI